FDANNHAPQAGSFTLRHHRFGQTVALVGAHGGRPGDRQLAADELIGDRLDALRPCEEGLILEREVVEAVAPPERLDLLAHTCGIEPDPFALVDKRIGAEGAAEIATL